MQTLFVALVVFGACSFAHGQAATKGKFLPIVFDDWWNIDYVKNGCEIAASEANHGNAFAKPCPVASTLKEIVKEFEDELEVAFASESVCHGLSLLHLTPEMVNTAVKHPMAPATGTLAKVATDHWALMLDLDGHSDGHSHTQSGQGWSLVDPANRVLNGRITTPRRVVQQLCKIAKGVGGKSES